MQQWKRQPDDGWTRFRRINARLFAGLALMGAVGVCIAVIGDRLLALGWGFQWTDILWAVAFSGFAGMLWVWSELILALERFVYRRRVPVDPNTVSDPRGG